MQKKKKKRNYVQEEIESINIEMAFLDMNPQAQDNQAWDQSNKVPANNAIIFNITKLVI